MPTRAENPKFYEDSKLTDYIPVCNLSGIGYSTNQIYQENGLPQEEHPFEDVSFHWKINDSTYLYGIFDGNEGSRIASFAMGAIASELCFGQLSEKETDEEIKDVLRQAFITIEKSYFEQEIGDKLAQRTVVKDEIPHNFNSYEAYQKYPHLVEQLKSLNGWLSCGTAAVVALIRNNRLFVANVGDSRALLCRTDKDGVMTVVQISCDHDLGNEDELLRLYNLGLEKLTQGSRLGNQEITRCLGNYLVKADYKDFQELAFATGEPIIADPEINGGIELDQSFRFLLLMSSGLYKSLQESGITENQVNQEIARLTVSEFREQSTLRGVAQAVVDRVVRQHRDTFMSGGSGGGGREGVASRDDITLLVRNLNFPLANANHPLTSPNLCAPNVNQGVRFDPNPAVHSIPPSTHGGTDQEMTTNSNSGMEDTNTTTTTEDTSDSAVPRLETVPAYVDFTEFYRNVEIARREGTLPAGIDFDFLH